MSKAAQDFLQALPEGYSNYIKVCLDPFHDRTIRFEGAPTSRNATSVVLCLNQELTLAADDFPSITDDTWDCHVTMYPFLNTLHCSWARETDAITTVAAAPDAPFTFYPLTAHGVNSGNPTFCTDNYVVPAETKGLSLAALLTYLSGNSDDGPGRRTVRLVGNSFEVVNESPEIYTQGAVTVYRYPLITEDSNRPFLVSYPVGYQPNPLGTTSPTTAVEHVAMWKRVVDLRAPPTNQACAVLVPGSQTWKAKDGAYCIATQYDSEVPFRTVENMNLLFTGYTPTIGTTYTGALADYSFVDENTPTPVQGSTGASLVPPAYDALNAVFPYNLSGAYFTGLSKQYTVLRLRFRSYVEILTDPCDNTLAPLASPTIPYKQDHQELVMEAISHLPPGVPQSWNPSGENWKMALQILGTTLSTAAPALSAYNPVLSGIATALGTAATLGADAWPTSPPSKGRRRSNRQKKSNRSRGVTVDPPLIPSNPPNPPSDQRSRSRSRSRPPPAPKTRGRSRTVRVRAAM